MPTSPAFVTSDWGITRSVALSESPFTGATQVHKYAKGQMVSYAYFTAYEARSGAFMASFFYAV